MFFQDLIILDAAGSRAIEWQAIVHTCGVPLILVLVSIILQWGSITTCTLEGKLLATFNEERVPSRFYPTVSITTEF